MDRRRFLRLAAAPVLAGGPARPSRSAAQGTRVLRYVPYTDVTVLDPTWSTAYVTRDHSASVYDTLFALDERLTPQHQMLAGAIRSDDGLTWDLTARPGLVFHDGSAVLGVSSVARRVRW